MGYRPDRAGPSRLDLKLGLEAKSPPRVMFEAPAGDTWGVWGTQNDSLVLWEPGHMALGFRLVEPRPTAPAWPIRGLPPSHYSDWLGNVYVVQSELTSHRLMITGAVGLAGRSHDWPGAWDVQGPIPRSIKGTQLWAVPSAPWMKQQLKLAPPQPL